MSKLSSVRVWITLVSCGLWVWLSVHDKVPAEFSTGLIALIISSYFNRSDRTQKTS